MSHFVEQHPFRPSGAACHGVLDLARAGYSGRVQLIPLLRFWRDIRTGAIAGTVVAVGFIVWRVTREGDAGWTALSFGLSAALFGAALGLWLWRWVPKHWGKSEPVPANAEVMASSKARWWALFSGFAFGFVAIGRAVDDNVIVAGVLAGLVAGALAGATAGIVRLQRFQAEHGQELLQWRRGGLRNPQHFLRDIDRRSDRFTREAESASNEDKPRRRDLASRR
jgi:hypothetical protein